jgi:hypothetical protein
VGETLREGDGPFQIDDTIGGTLQVEERAAEGEAGSGLVLSPPVSLGMGDRLLKDRG